MIRLNVRHALQQPRFIRWLVASWMLISLACTAALADDERREDSRVLGAYFGDSVLPQADNQLCAPQAAGEGFGGMPIVFSAQIDPFSLNPAAFRVKVSGQPGWVTPVCATLRPAVDPTELRTVLLVGDFGFGGASRPVAIRIVGDVRTTDGDSLRGLVTRRVSGTDVGPQLLLAERFAPGDGMIDTSTGDDTAFCPEGETTVVVKLTFSGGLTAPNGSSLQDNDIAIGAIQVVGTNSTGQRTVLSPFVLRDIDNDNHLDACFGAEVEELDSAAGRCGQPRVLRASERPEPGRGGAHRLTHLIKNTRMRG